MILSEIGKIALQYWREIPIHFPFVELGEYVVMPNHVHGIIIIDKPSVETANLAVSVEKIKSIDTKQTARLAVSTTVAASEKWKPETLGVIINQYKRACTIAARKIVADFEWQTRFYDHIIRNNESFERISNYIVNNPANWAEDKFHS